MFTNRDRKSFGSRRKNSKFAQTTGTVDVFDLLSGISVPTSLRASACPNLHEWWTQPAYVRCRCSATDLAEIGRSSKIISWILSIFSGVVTVFSRPERGASQVEKSPCLNWATQFLTVAYNVERFCFCHNGVYFLRRLALQGEKNLMTARVSMLSKSRASPNILPCSLCNKKILVIPHVNRPFFPTTLSIPSYDMGK